MIVVVYTSGSGHTAKLAQAVAEGAAAELIDITSADLDKAFWEKLHQAEAIIMGAPTYMGSISAPLKHFMDETGVFWVNQPWLNKIAAGFTIGTSASGDKLQSLQQMALFAMQHGMIWVGQDHVGSKHTKDGLGLNDAGSWLGLMAKSDTDKSILVPDQDLRTARRFGERVKNAVQRGSEGL